MFDRKYILKIISDHLITVPLGYLYDIYYRPGTIVS